MIDLRRAKAALAWMPRASLTCAEPRAASSMSITSFLRAVSFAMLALALGVALLWSAPVQAQTPNTPATGAPTITGLAARGRGS